MILFFFSLATCFPCLWSCFVFFSFFYAKQQQHAYHMLQFPSYKWWLQLWVCLYLFFIRFEPKSQTYICSRLCFLFFLKQNTKKKQKKILNNFLFCWWFSFRQLLVVCTIFFFAFQLFNKYHVIYYYCSKAIRHTCTEFLPFYDFFFAVFMECGFMLLSILA